MKSQTTSPNSLTAKSDTFLISRDLTPLEKQWLLQETKESSIQAKAMFQIRKVLLEALKTEKLEFD